jgi:hypothetical protein
MHLQQIHETFIIPSTNFAVRMTLRQPTSYNVHQGTHNIEAKPARQPRNCRTLALPNPITKNICRHAGREASAILHIALSNTDAISAAFQAVYYEPFSCWDWHGLHPDDMLAFEQKRRLILGTGTRVLNGRWGKRMGIHRRERRGRGLGGWCIGMGKGGVG